jgi:hypothetical protein
VEATPISRLPAINLARVKDRRLDPCQVPLVTNAARLAIAGQFSGRPDCCACRSTPFRIVRSPTHFPSVGLISVIGRTSRNVVKSLKVVANSTPH